MASATIIDTDALVIGAGPVGLFQVFQLGLQGLRCQVVDSLPAAGGQCAALYPHKPIYDVPALPVCSGQELTDRLLLQIKPFGAGLHLSQQVSTLQQRVDGRFDVGTSAGLRFDAKVVVIAGGVGAFEPRRLNVPGIDAMLGRQVFHGHVDAPLHDGQRVAVVGGGDAALDAVFAAIDAAVEEPVDLIHRREVFDASSDRMDRLSQLRAEGRVRCSAGVVAGVMAGEMAGEMGGVHEEGSASAACQGLQLSVLRNDGTQHAMASDVLLVCLGLSPRLGPIAGWGLDMERKQLKVDTERFATSLAGVYAVGDINTYPGKKKLIVCGFHEATLAAFAAARHIAPDQAHPLQYTTTSAKLHKLLGVEQPSATPRMAGIVIEG